MTLFERILVVKFNLSVFGYQIEHLIIINCDDLKLIQLSFFDKFLESFSIGIAYRNNGISYLY